METIKICRFLSQSGEEVLMKSLGVMIKALRCPNSEMGFRYFQSGFYKFISSNLEAIPLHHLFQLNQVVMDLYNKMSENDDLYDLYQEYFMILMELLSLPLYAAKEKYLTVYYEDLVEFYNNCAFIFKNTQRIEIVRKILGTLMLHTNNRSVMGSKSVTTIKAIITSKLPEAISELLATSDFETYLEYLTAMEKLLSSDLECEAFFKLNVVDTILKRLSYKSQENGDDSDEEIAKLPVPVHLNLSQRVLWVLIIAFYKSSQEFKQKCGVIVSEAAWKLFSSSDFLNIVFMSEIPIADKTAWYSNAIFYPDKLDFDFKISLMSVLCLKQISPSSYMLRVINAIPAILLILNEEAQLIWTSTQRKHLIYYALVGLQNIVGIDPEHFLNQGGPKRLIQVFNKILNEPQDDLLFQLLCCIHKSLIPDNNVFDGISKEYEQNGILKLIETLLSRFLNVSVMCRTIQYSLSTVYCILEKMMKKFSTKMSQITKISLELLSKVKVMAGFFRPLVLIAIMNYFWEVLAYNDDDCFVKNGGIFLLLDIIEEFPLAIKMLGLSILSDFCQIPSYLTCMLTWRGKNGETLLVFLMKIYREQAEFDRKNFNSKYLIHDVNPSITDKSDHKFKLNKTKTPSLVILDIFSSCKPKIASILHIVNCSEQTELVNQCYHISKMDLSYDDKITTTLAKLYYNLKLGEAWIEIDNFLKFQDLKPFVFDQSLLDYRIEEYNRCLRHVNIKQKRYQKQKENKELTDEYAFYNRLKQQQLSESLDSLQELRRIAISTKKQFKIEEYKKMMEQLVDRTPQDDTNLHKTLPDGIHVCVYNHKVNILSDVVINLDEEKAPKGILSLPSLNERIFDTTNNSENDCSSGDNCVQDNLLRCNTYFNRDVSK